VLERLRWFSNDLDEASWDELTIAVAEGPDPLPEGADPPPEGESKSA
jgi:hypothetical protein